MPLAGHVDPKPIEYFIVHEARPVGPSMGRYADKEIPSSIIDALGRRYAYAGVAPRKWNGQFDVDALRAGEFILLPGLIYRREGAKSSWLASLLRLD